MGIITKKTVCSDFIYNRKYEYEGKRDRRSTKCTSKWVTKQRFKNSYLFPLQVKRRGGTDEVEFVTPVNQSNWPSIFFSRFLQFPVVKHSGRQNNHFIKVETYPVFGVFIMFVILVITLEAQES